MKRIALCGKYGEGKFAEVDDEDYEFLSKLRWGVSKFGVVSVAQTMGNLLMKTPKGMVCDHKDRNGFNCQKGNLRKP